MTPRRPLPARGVGAQNDLHQLHWFGRNCNGGAVDGRNLRGRREFERAVLHAEFAQPRNRRPAQWAARICKIPARAKVVLICLRPACGSDAAHQEECHGDAPAKAPAPGLIFRRMWRSSGWEAALASAFEHGLLAGSNAGRADIVVGHLVFTRCACGRVPGQSAISGIIVRIPGRFHHEGMPSTLAPA